MRCSIVSIVAAVETRSIRGRSGKLCSRSSSCCDCATSSSTRARSRRRRAASPARAGRLAARRRSATSVLSHRAARRRQRRPPSRAPALRPPAATRAAERDRSARIALLDPLHARSARRTAAAPAARVRVVDRALQLGRASWHCSTCAATRPPTGSPSRRLSKWSIRACMAMTRLGCSSSSRRRACARASCDLEKLGVRPSRRAISPCV